MKIIFTLSIMLYAGAGWAIKASPTPQCSSHKSDVKSEIASAMGTTEADVSQVATGVWYNWHLLRGRTCLFIDEHKSHYTIRVTCVSHDFFAEDELGVCAATKSSRADFIAEADLQGKGYEQIGINANQDFSKIEITNDKLRGWYQRISPAEVPKKCGVSK